MSKNYIIILTYIFVIHLKCDKKNYNSTSTQAPIFKSHQFSSVVDIHILTLQP